MLVLIKHNDWFSRPKYIQTRTQKLWVVWNTDEKTRAYEPDTRSECERWRNDEQRLGT